MVDEHATGIARTAVKISELVERAAAGLKPLSYGGAIVQHQQRGERAGK